MGKNNKINIENIFKTSIREGKFFEAKDLMNKLSEKELSDYLIAIAFESQNILSYVFINYLIVEKETAEHHSLACDILSSGLCHLNGGYQAALYHARRALELDPKNVIYKEEVLFFYGIPDKLVSKEEAVDLAKEVLKDKPDSWIAKEIIE